MIGLAYASQVWYLSKTNLKIAEKVQRKATTWLYCQEDHNKNRLVQIDLLPVSLYLELHNVLFLNATQNDKYNIRVMFLTRSTDTRQKEYEETKNFLGKTHENFWLRTARLVKIIRKHLKDKPLDKTTLTKMYQHYFNKSYSEAETSTWRILFSCGSCNPSQNLCQMQTEWVTPLAARPRLNYYY